MLRCITLRDCRKIISYLEQPPLLQNPRILGKALLHDNKGSWRYRVGDYRIICQIIEKELMRLSQRNLSLI